MQCIGFGSIYPSMFQNLVRLNFKVTRTNWHVLQSLLVVAPNLEVLVIDKFKSFYSDRKKKRERDFGNEKKIFLMKRKLYCLILSFQ